MFPTQTVVAGYSWGYMLEDPKNTDLARVDIDPFCTRRDAGPVTLGWATFTVPRLIASTSHGM